MNDDDDNMMDFDDLTLSMNNNNNFELHYFVFKNDLNSVKNYIKCLDRSCVIERISIRDIHGNTPLHLACMLGHMECARMLVDAGAIVKIRNRQMWTPLNEAISFGNRDLIKIILEKYIKEFKSLVSDSKPKILDALSDMIDFYVEIKWDFESWIPLVSRFLPSDLCKLYKKGTNIRIDCTLGDFAASKASNNNSNNNSSKSTNIINWQRGDLTFLFDLKRIGQKNSIYFMDNKRKTYTNIVNKDIDSGHDDRMSIENEVNMYLSKDMFFIKSYTKHAHFMSQQIGWFSKRDRIETLNGYVCQFYDVNNLFVISKLRNEHLTEEDLKKNEEKEKQFRKKFHNRNNNTSTSITNPTDKNNNTNDDDELNDEEDDDEDFLGKFDFKPSLDPPQECNVTWSEYIESKPGDWPCLGRILRVKASQKEFKAQIAMSQEFPLSLSDLNKLLDALAPLAKFRKIKEFLTAKLPPGFPVKIEIPVVPTVTAKVSFQNFKKNSIMDDSLFTVPSDYIENQDKDDEHTQDTDL